jgi:hypothetical protein
MPAEITKYQGKEHGNVKIENSRHSIHPLRGKMVSKVYFDEKAAFGGV